MFINKTEPEAIISGKFMQNDNQDQLFYMSLALISGILVGLAMSAIKASFSKILNKD